MQVVAGGNLCRHYRKLSIGRLCYHLSSGKVQKQIISRFLLPIYTCFVDNFVSFTAVHAPVICNLRHVCLTGSVISSKVLLIQVSRCFAFQLKVIIERNEV